MNLSVPANSTVPAKSTDPAKSTPVASCDLKRDNLETRTVHSATTVDSFASSGSYSPLKRLHQQKTPHALMPAPRYLSNGGQPAQAPALAGYGTNKEAMPSALNATAMATPHSVPTKVTPAMLRGTRHSGAMHSAIPSTVSTRQEMSAVTPPKRSLWQRLLKRNAAAPSTPVNAATTMPELFAAPSPLTLPPAPSASGAALGEALSTAAAGQVNSNTPQQSQVEDSGSTYTSVSTSGGGSTSASASQPSQEAAYAVKRISTAARSPQAQLRHYYGQKRFDVLLHALRSQAMLVIMACCGFIIALVATAALVAKSMQSSVVPYIVEVDQQGVVLNDGLLPAAPEVPPAVLTAQMCDFIRNVRMVTPDKTLQRQLMTRAYAFVAPDSKVYDELGRFFLATDPLDPQSKAEVRVEILNVIDLGHNTLQIDWLEQQPADLTTALSLGTHGSTTTPSANAWSNPNYAGTSESSYASGNRYGLNKRSSSASAFSEPLTQKWRALITYEQSSKPHHESPTLLLNPLNLLVKEYLVTAIIA